MVFSQGRMSNGVIAKNILDERLLKIEQTTEEVLHRLNGSNSFPSKSKSGNWSYLLQNQQKEFYNEVYNSKDTRALIFKTRLDNEYLLIETIYQLWDGVNWVNDLWIQYTYDTNNLLIEELTQKYQISTGWKNYTLIFYSYDNNSNLIEKLLQYWYYGNEWMNSKKFNYSYNLYNNLIEEVYQLWRGLYWENESRTTYAYNVNNLLTQESYQLWEYHGGSGWVEVNRIIYTYDDKNNLIEKLFQRYYGYTLLEQYKYTYIYDWNNRLVEDLGQSFKYGDTSWVNSSKKFYSYDLNNNLIEELYQQWMDSIWVDTSKTLYSYDGSNNLIEQYNKVWDGLEWLNYSIGSYIYDGNNNQIETLNQIWDDSSWVNVDRYLYSYIIVDVEQFEGEVKTYSLSNNYPNPFNPSTKIKYSIPSITLRQAQSDIQVSLKVFDVLGNEIETLVNEEKPAGTYEITWYAENLPSGVYFYQLRAGNFIETKKMLLLK
jgi:hypothetical protein